MTARKSTIMTATPEEVEPMAAYVAISATEGGALRAEGSVARSNF